MRPGPDLLSFDHYNSLRLGLPSASQIPTLPTLTANFLKKLVSSYSLPSPAQAFKDSPGPMGAILGPLGSAPCVCIKRIPHHFPTGAPRFSQTCLFHPLSWVSPFLMPALRASVNQRKGRCRAQIAGGWWGGGEKVNWQHSNKGVT